jgi:K+-sensing histidine kinase KdpD
MNDATPAASAAAPGSRAMVESLKVLDALRYALDQAAIVAATDQRGVIDHRAVSRGPLEAAPVPLDSQRHHVSQPFFTTRAGGTGLGLAIVRRLLELQEGSVALNDRPAGGTIAKIAIPLAPR